MATPRPPHLLTIPREVRDLIGEYLLISGDRIDLIELKQGQGVAKRSRSLGLTVSIMFTCGQLYEEVRRILYGANTFFLDLHAPFSPNPIYGFGAQNVCLTCTGTCTYGSLQTSFFRGIAATAQECHAQPAWNPNIRLVRRLHVSLRPYSYSQFLTVSYFAYNLSNDLALVQRCSHSWFRGLPNTMSLDLCVIEVERASIVLSEENLGHSKAAIYPLWSESWKSQLQEDMKKELSGLLQYAAKMAGWILLTGRGLNDYEHCVSDRMVKTINDRGEGERARIIRSIADLPQRASLREHLACISPRTPVQLSADQLKMALVMDSASCTRLVTIADENGDDIVAE